MSAGIANELPGPPAATLSVRRSRRGWVSAGLLVVLLSATAVARLSGHLADLPQTTTAAGQVSSSQAWLVAHDYRLVAAVDGVTTQNVTAIRRGDTVRGDVQTMAAGEQTDYYRFRIRAGEVETATTGPLGTEHWLPASPAQATLVNSVTDPGQMLAPFQSPAGLRSLGRSGDTKVYANPRGDTLFTADGRPVQLVVHGPDGVTRAIRIAATPAPATR